MTTSLDSPRGARVPPETPIFAATLAPNRSLGPFGTRLLLGLAALVALVSAVPFLLMGAWPIGGFLGLDIALLYIGFRINNRDARRREQIVLSRIELLIRKIGWRGDVDERRFNPFWVRLHTEEDPDYGMVRLAVVQRREEIEVGSFLAPAERADLAGCFRGALAEARR